MHHDLLGEYQHQITPEMLRVTSCGDRFPRRLTVVPR
jgi:hypothetical protein